ncbi:unnamed protein product [Allacma fusca]|uniref:Catenin delta-2 n=1 Tax=Allacma fusca TaxID=39272 RepID=A0A8J2LFM9_9HEXA|nr:unnamed protein product [Allacma fusca]
MSLVSRQVTEQRQERIITRTEYTHQSFSILSQWTKGDASFSSTNGLTQVCTDTFPHNSHHSGVGNSQQQSSPNSTISSNHTFVSRISKQQTTQQETKITEIVREIHQMGPDGQPMDYSTVPRPNQVSVPGADYVQAGSGYGTNPRPHYPPSSNAAEHSAYDPNLVQDPYYGRGTLPPEAAGRRYIGYSGGVPGGTYNDYDHYPEYPDLPGGSVVLGHATSSIQYAEYRNYSERPATPPSPSERSDSPSVNRPQNSDYLRQAGGYPPTGYEELDSGVAPPPRPEYLSPSATNAHPAAYEEDRGNNGSGGYGNWNNSGVTSHYGNLPARPYLIGSGGTNSDDNQEPSTSVPNNISSDSRIQSPPSLHRHHHHHHHSHPPPLEDETADANHLNNTGVRWRDPDLHEVIQFLGNPNPVVKANAAAYLQHLSYMDDPVKAKTRALGGIPPLVALLSHDQPEVHRNACGALRNLSYGRQNDENKKAIKSAGGIPALVRLLKRTPDNEVKELVTGVMWNLSSCEELKKAIIDDGVIPLVNCVIIPHSGWDRNNMSGTSTSHVPDACWSTVFKNASGVLRNVSSAGEYARKKLRECEGVVEALLHVIRCALSRADIDDKSVENCVCILRNLSYRCQEVEDPNYDKHPPPAQSRATATQGKSENLGCFGANKKKKEAALAASSPKDGHTISTGPARSSSQNKTEPVRGMELLWQPEVVQAYLALLSNCSNPETLEAAAGAIQNLAACYWQPSIEIRAAVRKEKGLPVLVELLRMEVDRVVCAVATALRNLALDQRNKELIGKYAMRDLVQKLPSGRPHDQGTSDDTIAAVLATLNEVIKKNAEFSRSLMEAEGVERLVLLTQQKRRYSPRVVKFASQVLYSMWQHQELREVYKKAGWTEQDFVSKGTGGRGGSPAPGGSGTEPSSAGSPVNANSTLNRPMASQSGTRYEDKTMQRGANNSVPKSPPPSYPQGEEVPLADMPYPDGGSHAPPPGAFRMYPNQPVKPGEPLYAQVNREKKKNRHFEGNSRVYGGYSGSPSEGHWQDNSNSVKNHGLITSLKTSVCLYR